MEINEAQKSCKKGGYDYCLLILNILTKHFIPIQISYKCFLHLVYYIISNRLEKWIYVHDEQTGFQKVEVKSDTDIYHEDNHFNCTKNQDSPVYRMF